MHNGNLSVNEEQAFKISEQGLSSNPLIRYFQKEARVFKTLSQGCRRLILSNFVYIFIMMSVQFISAAFVYSIKEGDVLYNMVYYFGVYSGTTLGFLVTGLLLRFIKVNYLYATGIMFGACSFVPLLFIKDPSAISLFTAGLFVGIGNGMFWSNRHYMTILSTNNKERNYFGGLDSALGTIAQVLAPIIFGITVTNSTDKNAVADVGNYKILFVFIIAMFLIAFFNIVKGKFSTVPLKKFIYGSYDSAWNRQRMVNFLEGIAEGGLFTIPPILIFLMVGKGELGTIDSISVILSTIPVFLMGRYTKPKHRIYVLALSLASLFIGSFILAVNYVKVGIIIFYAFSKLAYILNSFMYATIRLRSIDVSKQINNRDEYAFIFDAELFTEAGRLLTIGAFCFVYFKLDANTALQYTLLVVSLIQMFALVFVRKMKQE
jgi:MFS transporter, YQGE family, putative transporter